MPKRPSFQMYPGDWKRDPALTMCNPATRGIWMDVICAMHENDQCGELEGRVDQLARVCRCTTEEMQAAIDELNETKTADVTFCHGKVTLINRRMKKEFQERKSANLRKKKERSRGSHEEVADDVTEKSRLHSSSSTSIQQNYLRNSDAEASEKGVSEFVWREGVKLLTAKGGKEETARTFLGRMCKEHGTVAAMKAIEKAIDEDAVEPRAYIARVLANSARDDDPLESIMRTAVN